MVPQGSITAQLFIDQGPTFNLNIAALALGELYMAIVLLRGPHGAQLSFNNNSAGSTGNRERKCIPRQSI